MSDNSRQEIGYVPDWDSCGWRQIQKRLERIIDTNPLIKNRLLSARIGFDLGSGRGQSAYALSLLCPSLSILHCVDNNQVLMEPFKTALQIVAVEHTQTMQEFLADRSVKGEPKADVIMIASMQGQPFFETSALKNLALSIESGGILFEVNSDYSHEY